MGDFDFSDPAQRWVVIVLVWIGFGTMAGLLARVLIPGREPGGAAGTVFVGIIGSALGPFLLTTFWPRDGFNPISPLGLLAAVAASVVVLVAYRLAAAYLFVPREDEP
jgi:uncharacterized membrane protein YeaQ/YmgE (transglycosylase-associated protein family)